MVDGCESHGPAASLRVKVVEPISLTERREVCYEKLLTN